MPITNILGMKVQVTLKDGKIVDMRPVSEFAEGAKVIDGVARRVEADKGKLLGNHQKPSSDRE